MTEPEETSADFPVPKQEPLEAPFDEAAARELTSAGLEVPSNVVFVDQAGNVLGDLSMALDSSQMPVFITHVAKASDCTEENESVIELSEVNPSHKRKRKDDDDEPPFNLKNWLMSLQEKVNGRLKVIEEKASSLDLHAHLLNQKTQNLATQINKLSRAKAAGKGRNGTIIVGLPPSSSSDDIFPIISNVYSGSPAYQLITHSSEDEYPDGSWLGDPDNVEMRVRCPVPAKDLEAITKNCPTGEKMALTLLDYLFDRETQACSNISGNSKHGKKQLDPLKIYGIRCHIMHHFGVDDGAWQKIKLNLDSKCRTAFRRKLKGMPLTVKAFKDSRTGAPFTPNPNDPEDQEDCEKDVEGGDEEGDLSRLPSLEEEEQVPKKGTLKLNSSPRTYSRFQPRLLPKMCMEEEEDDTAAVLSLMEAEGEGQMDADAVPVTLHAGGSALSLPLGQLYGEPQVLFASQTPQLIQTEQGDFQLLQATPEQLAHIQQGHPVQILTTAASDTIQVGTGQDPC